MDMNKSTKAKALASELLKADLQSNAKGCELPALEDWEMVMVGGGDGVACW